MKCPKCYGESVSRINPLIDYGAAAAAGAACGSVMPLVGTVFGALLGAAFAAANNGHHTMQIYHKCGGCGYKF